MAPKHLVRQLPLTFLIVAIGTCVLAPSAAASVIGPRAGHSPNADDIRTAYWVMLVVAGIIVLAVHAALGVAIVRFRARRGRRPRALVAGRRTVLRAAAPIALLAAGIFAFGIVMASKARDVQPSEAAPPSLSSASGLTAQAGSLGIPSGTNQLEVKVVGQQWLWRFDYPVGPPPDPPYDVFSFNELVVPVNTTVILDITSTDVLHRWFIPALGGEVDAVPGQTNQTWFRANRVGVYPGQSMQYSGPGFPAMRAWVRVVSADQFKRFISQKQSEILAAQKYVQRRTAASPTGTVTP